MDLQKIEQLLTDTFDDSFLSGDTDSVQDDSVKAEVSVGGSDRLAGLDDGIRADIEELIRIEQNYPIRGWLSGDGSDAGILLLESVREYHWDVFKHYATLFWGRAHGDVCTVFKTELVTIWRRYIKIPWPAGLDKSGFVLEA